MTIVTLHVSGSANPDEAWERYADPARWPEWSPQISRVETAAPRLTPAMTGRVFGPIGVRISFTVDQVDEAGRNWSWTVHVGPERLAQVQLRLHHTVTGHERGSATTLRLEGPLPLVLPYAPVARFALSRLVTA